MIGLLMIEPMLRAEFIHFSQANLTLVHQIGLEQKLFARLVRVHLTGKIDRLTSVSFEAFTLSAQRHWRRHVRANVILGLILFVNDHGPLVETGPIILPILVVSFDRGGRGRSHDGDGPAPDHRFRRPFD
ncbi:hypothetical protein BpHYR1_053043 [Brachionus plicatilis]|uniref:Uncharacterized protein n=1 Tax=Brachionus plicatilis TaxID=10195 RepID=A0A3M7T057_BRAPC|nr:hypothetical protein BpHYR1_053043 [Brachionus plicatilis]